MSTEPWESLLLSWLRDPVDKAADIQGQIGRARLYASIVMDREVADHEIGHAPDHPASAHERLPMPLDTDETPVVAPDRHGNVLLHNPLSGEARHVKVSLDPAATSEKLRTLVNDQMSMARRFLTVWRLAPEIFPEAPADTRCPDHTLWHDLDTKAAIAWASKDGHGGAALLSFKLSPVQPFIEASRSLRDLLSGSYLLSWLCFAAMGPVLEACGPTALVYPALRRIPLMDCWLKERGVAVEPDRAKLARASIPNRFLAIVPHAQAADLAAAVRDAGRTAWLAAGRDVHRELAQRYAADFPGWDRLWDRQIESYFDFRTTWLALSDSDFANLHGVEGTSNRERVASLTAVGFAGSVAIDRWRAAVELSAGLMRAAGRIRNIPDYAPDGDVPQKCTLLGTYEQMGPARLADSRRFWEKESKEKADADRRCAVALVKKHAFFAHLRRKVGFDLDQIHFPDTEDIAGENNHYYAILALDADDMGAWLSGERLPLLRDVLHPHVVAYLERDRANRDALGARRPLSPALHSAISQALTHFAVYVAPEIVERHGGRLIYSGGDDLLAAMSVTSALQCARELRAAFRAPEVMGGKSSVSAGLAVAHVKEDLRYVLTAVRKAERLAKNEGKDRLALAILRRSGEHGFCTCSWEYIDTLQGQVASFARGDSDRWAYQLRRQLEILKVLSPVAFRNELSRIIRRSETPNTQFIQDFDKFAQSSVPSGAAEQFVALCQSASFLARGETD